jgi:hypothetical protein
MDPAPSSPQYPYTSRKHRNLTGVSGLCLIRVFESACWRISPHNNDGRGYIRCAIIHAQNPEGYGFEPAVYWTNVI